MRKECNNCARQKCPIGDHARKYVLGCGSFEAPPSMLKTMILELACHSNINSVARTLQALGLQVNPKYDGRNELIIEA